MYAYDAANVDELSLSEGDVVNAIRFEDAQWILVYKKGNQGLVPYNYLRCVDVDRALVLSTNADEKPGKGGEQTAQAAEPSKPTIGKSPAAMYVVRSMNG